MKNCIFCIPYRPLRHQLVALLIESIDMTGLEGVSVRLNYLFHNVCVCRYVHIIFGWSCPIFDWSSHTKRTKCWSSVWTLKPVIPCFNAKESLLWSDPNHFHIRLSRRRSMSLSPPAWLLKVELLLLKLEVCQASDPIYQGNGRWKPQSYGRYSSCIEAQQLHS